ncbi:MAG: hypothetical protein ACREQJ_04975, partial [Candidatus Binatia bacterium]
MRRVLRWLGISLAAIVVVVVGSALVVVRTDRFRAWLRDQVVVQLNAGWKGELAVGRLEGSIFGDLLLHDVRLRYENVDVLVVPEVALGYELLPILSGRVEVTRLDIADPVADLRQDAESRWNVLEAISSRIVEPAPPPSEGGLVIALEKIGLANGTISVAPVGQPAVRLASVALEAGAEILPNGTTAEVKAIEAKVEREGVPPFRVVAGLEYSGAEPPHVVELRSIVVETERSKASMRGRVSGLDVV